MSKKALIVTRVSGFVPQFEMNNVKILQEMGYEIHYATNFKEIVYGVDNARLNGTGIKRHLIPFERGPFSMQTSLCYKLLIKLMLEEDFDLIHCHMPLTGVLTRKAAEHVKKCTGKKIPVIYTAHGFHFFKGAPIGNWLYYIAERHYARYTDRLLLINEEDYKRGCKFPIRGEVVKVNGVGIKPMPPRHENFNLRGKYGIPEENTVVVSVGELTPLKNHITMMKAMDRFRRENLTYVVCGQGPIQDELEEAIQGLHLEKKVVLAGYCDNIADVLRQSQIFAFPSVREGLSVAMMEAMQAGLPVLAANIRGNKDLIEDGQGGFLFEENLVEDYVRALHYLLKYPDEAKRMGEWNQKRVDGFTLKNVECQMREIYENITIDIE